MPLFLNSEFLLKTPPSPILMRLFPDTSLHFSPKTEWSCCCVIRVWWRCVTVVVIVVVMVVGWIEGGVLGGVEAGKFRNCLIFPRKGCKKSLEMYRIFFLNSSFIDLFFKRQLTGWSNSSFLNDYYVVCPPQLKCSFHKSGASTYINAMLFKKELWWQKNNPCLSKTTRGSRMSTSKVKLPHVNRFSNILHLLLRLLSTR